LRFCSIISPKEIRFRRITGWADDKGRKIVTDYLKGITERVYPVGRLDYDTEGLLLLTNDGDFANLLTHPKHHVPKTYHATVKGIPHGTALDKLKAGINLEDGMTAPAEVEYKDIDEVNKEAVISITIHEGRNRQVRRMFEAIALYQSTGDFNNICCGVYLRAKRSYEFPVDFHFTGQNHFFTLTSGRYTCLRQNFL